MKLLRFKSGFMSRHPFIVEFRKDVQINNLSVKNNLEYRSQFKLIFKLYFHIRQRNPNLISDHNTISIKECFLSISRKCLSIKKVEISIVGSSCYCSDHMLVFLLVVLLFFAYLEVLSCRSLRISVALRRVLRDWNVYIMYDCQRIRVSYGFACSFTTKSF